jgi:hypothetical protein
MSHTAHCFIETKLGKSKDWFIVAQVFLYGDVDVDSVLAYPWGKFRSSKKNSIQDEGGNIKPIVPKRGVPHDLSIMARYRYTWTILKPGNKRYPEDDRVLTPKEAASCHLKPFGKTGHWLDLDEWRSGTWLTLSEVEKAARRFMAVRGVASRDLESILGMMRPQLGETRLVIWYS